MKPNSILEMKELVLFPMTNYYQAANKKEQVWAEFQLCCRLCPGCRVFDNEQGGEASLLERAVCRGTGTSKSGNSLQCSGCSGYVQRKMGDGGT